MTIEETIILLPCHTLDDFPYYYEGVEADNVLAGYSALWHPALIAHTGKTPAWQTSYNDDAAQLANRLVVLSKVAEDDLPGFWLDQARHEGATVIPASEATSRHDIVAAALAAIEHTSPTIDPELVQDFLALGFCHLLSELLTVQMRYASLVDHDFFQKQLVAAATAAMQNDVTAAREKLQACFDVLAQSRDHYYPVDGYLIDLTLVELTTMGKALRDEIAGETARNLLISSKTLEAMQETEPETLRAIREGIERGVVSLIGGDADDQEFALLGNEAMLSSIRRGGDIFEKLVGCRPRVFGRRRFGLTPTLPGLLSQTGYVGVLHFTLDGGRFAEPQQSKTLWEGIDGGTIDAFARSPLDASRSDSFLCFSQRMGESMDMDHVAVVCYAHWPGQASPWYDDLRRVASFGPALGKFVSLEHLLTETDTPRDHCRYGVDDYRSPYLRQAVAAERPDPISASVARSQDDAKQATLNTLATMAGVVRRTSNGGSTSEVSVEAATAEFATALSPNTDSATAPTKPMGGYLVTNPLSTPRRVAVEVPELSHPPAVTAPIEAAYRLANERADERGDKQEVLVEVPALGYVWIAADESQTWTSPSGKLLAEDNVIRNEHVEVTINRETGAIQSVRCPGFRNNLLSQQLALRVPDSTDGGLWAKQSASYSVMVADAVEVISAGPVSASIKSRGRLVNHQGQPLANFSQTVSLIRNRPVLEIDIELDPIELPSSADQPDADPWNTYYASRIAWADSGSELFRSVCGGSHPTELKQLEAPDFIEIRGARFRTSILTGGLPYHRRIDDHTLDTILITGNEQARHFRLGIGLNLNQPHAAAAELLASAPNLYANEQQASAAAAGWLFHINARNVAATHWELINDGDQVVGVRMRLQEVAGRSTSCTLRSIYPIERAQQVDFSGGMLAELPYGPSSQDNLPGEELPSARDSVMIEMHPHHWCEVELYWKP